VVIHRLLSGTGSARHLKLAGPIPYVREMLQISGVTEYIEIYDTVDEAVASF
jgi:hypothetical protein